MSAGTVIVCPAVVEIGSPQRNNKLEPFQAGVVSIVVSAAPGAAAWVSVVKARSSSRPVSDS